MPIAPRPPSRTRTRVGFRVGAVTLSLALGTAAVAACSASSREPSVPANAAAPAGQPNPVPGFDGVTIRIGEISAITGPNGHIGLPLTAGSKAYFDYVNTELGGIGRKYQVALDVKDTAGDPAKATAAYAAVRTGTVLLAQVLGGPIVTALLPQLRADGALAAPTLAADDLRDPNLLPTGVPVSVQAMNALEWHLAQTDRAAPLCSIVQDDAYGAAGAAGLEYAAKQRHVSLGTIAHVPAPPSAPGKLDATFAQLRTAGCGAVVLITTPAAATAVLTQAGAAQLPIQWIGLTASWTSTLATSGAAGYLLHHFVVVTDGADYTDGRVGGIVELVRIKAAYAPALPPDPWFTVGFAQAEAVTQVLEKAVALGDLSRAGILRASQAVGTVSFGGVAGAYTYGKPADRRPPTTTGISAVDPTRPTGLKVSVASVHASYADAFLIAAGP